MNEYYTLKQIKPKKQLKQNPKFEKLLEDFLTYCKGNKPIEFLELRKYPDSILEFCKIGFCDFGVYDELLNGQGYSKKELVEAGLINDKGSYIFQDRVIFIMKNNYFSARTLNSKSNPAYKNLFPKTEFAGNKKPFAIKGNSKRIFFVEGEPDAIATKLYFPEDYVFAVGGVNSTLSVFRDVVKGLENPSDFEFVLALDNDEKGREWTEKFKEEFSFDYSLFELHFPTNYKDIDELWRDKQEAGVKELNINKVNDNEETPEVNPSIELFFPEKSLIYEHKEQKKTIFSITQETKYTLQIVSLGVGNEDILVYNQGDSKQIGQVNLYLKHMNKDKRQEIISEMKEKGIKNLCKNLNIDIKGQSLENLKEIILQQNIFFENTLPIPEERLLNIENGLTFLSNLIKHNSFFDEELLYTMLIDVLEIDRSLVQPNQIMPFNPHKIIVTNPKTGKTSLSTTISSNPPSETPTEAGLLGFATADKAVVGQLHNKTNACSIDEIQEEQKDNILGKLHSLIEKGSMIIPKGVGLSVSSYATLNILGNPKEEKEQTDDLRQYIKLTRFKHIVNKFSTNTQAVASRFGLILYGNFEKVKGSMPNAELHQKQIAYCRAIAKYYSSDFSRAFLNSSVQKWLAKDYPTSYQEAVKKFRDSSQDFFIKDFYEGHLESYRHLRGGAFKLAFLEKGIEQLNTNQEVNFDDLLHIADKHLDRLLQVNLNSFEDIAGALENDICQQYYVTELQSIKPLYAKYFLFSVLTYRAENISANPILVAQQLQKTYTQVIVPIENIGSEDKYSRFSTVIKTVSENYQKLNSTFEKYGLIVDLKNGELIIIVQDENKFGKAVREYKKVTKVTKVTENE